MVNRTLLPSTLALLLSFASIASLAQSPPIHGLAHVAYRVKDVSASRSFYQKLGYGEAFAFEKDGVITQSFLKVNDRQFIELYPAAAPQPLAPQPLDPSRSASCISASTGTTCRLSTTTTQPMDSNPPRSAKPGQAIYSSPWPGPMKDL